MGAWLNVQAVSREPMREGGRRGATGRSLTKAVPGRTGRTPATPREVWEYPGRMIGFYWSFSRFIYNASCKMNIF